MKVAVLSESSADEAAIRILVDGIHQVPTQPVAGLPLRGRGWPSVRTILPTILKYLHFRTDADALVLVVDSNHSPPHEASHSSAAQPPPACRLCQLRSIADQTRSDLSPVAGRSLLKVAFGLAVPAVEAWYLCGRDPHVNEAAWVNGLRAGRDPYTKDQLKRSVYGTERPSLALETQFAVEAAKRLGPTIGLLEQSFPHGFGPLARDVRSWQGV